MKNWIGNRLIWIDNNIGETRERKEYVAIESTFAEEYIAISSYPNPFSDQITFTLDLENNHNVKIFVYNISGQKIHDVVDTYLTTGYYDFTWYGQGHSGNTVSPGIYFYSVIVDGRLIKSGKLIKQ